jgi:hypothetical protein
MSKQGQTAKAPTAAKQATKPSPAPALEGGVATLDAQADFLGLGAASSLHGQAGRLGDARLRAVQRQMLANKIGQTQGNGHLGQVLTMVSQHQQIALSQPNNSHTVQANTHDLHVHQPESVQAESTQSLVAAESVKAIKPSPESRANNAQQSAIATRPNKLVQRGVGDLLGDAWEGVQSIGSRALGALQRLGSGMLSRLQRLGSGVLERLGQMGEAALEWGPRILSFATNPVGALTGGLWLLMPDDLKPPLINTILRFASSILSRIRGMWAALVGPLWPLASAFMLGFIRRMTAVGDPEKIRLSNKLAEIMSGGSLNFIIGLAKGLVLGLWDVIKMPYDLVVGIIDGVKFIANVLSNLGLEAIQSGAELLANSLSAAWEGLRQMAFDPRRAVQLIQTIWSSISQAVGRMGQGIAQALLNFINLPDDQMGEQVGRFASEFAVDGLLAIFTAGAGALLRRGASLAGQFMRWFRRGGRAMGPMMRMIRSVVEPLLEGLGNVGRVFRNSRFGEWLGNLRAWLNRLMDSIGDVVSRGTRRGRAGRRAIGETADDIGDAGRRGRRAADDGMENAREYAEARAITAASERRGVPAQALIRLLSRRFPRRLFRSVPLAPGHSRIVMRAELDDDYHSENAPLSEQVRDEFEEAQNLGSRERLTSDTETHLSLDEIRSSLGEGPESSAINYVTSSSRAGTGRLPQHHVLPQQHRPWFEDRGFSGQQDIDRFTVSMGEGEHQAIHRRPRQWENEWNRRIMRELTNAETELGRRLTVREIWEITTRLMRVYGIPQEFIPYRRRG